jgi:cystathionine gamma-synthase
VTTASGEDVTERIGFHQNAMGAVAGPFDAWLVLRGLKTLAVRMERHCDNAEGSWSSSPATTASPPIFYPGLADHLNHEVAARQMKPLRRHGLLPRPKAARTSRSRSCGETQLWTLGESLGGVESLIEHPGRMTHASVAGTELEVPGDLIRLSVGIEDVEDLIADLKQALDRLT